MRGSLVARRGRLPGLPALVPGLRRRRGRRPARLDLAPRPPRVARRRRALALADLPLADRRLRLRRRRLHGDRPRLRHARRLRRADRASAERAGLRLLMDLVASHTSIEHPWFREHPDWYVWADGGPPNNWRAPSAARPGAATSAAGAGTCTPSIPSSPTSTGATPRCARRSPTWPASGVDARRRRLPRRRGAAAGEGPELRDDPPATAAFPLPLHPELAALERVHSRTAPGITEALAGAARGGRRRAARRRGLPARRARCGPYLEHLDLAFAFEFLHAPWDAARSAR